MFRIVPINGYPVDGRQASGQRIGLKRLLIQYVCPIRAVADVLNGVVRGPDVTLSRGRRCIVVPGDAGRVEYVTERQVIEARKDMPISAGYEIVG